MSKPALADKLFLQSDSLSRTVLDLVSKWGTAQQLNRCCLRVDIENGETIWGTWSAGQGAVFHRLPIHSDDECCCLSGQGLPVVADGPLKVTLYGEPLASLWAASAEWRDLTGQLLLQRLRFDDELRRQKLEAMAQYAAGAGHEINNPLATMINRARQLLSEESDPEKRRWLETIGAQAYRIRDMIGDTMLFARPPAPQLESVDVLHEITQVMGRFTEEFQQRGISLFVPIQRRDGLDQPVRIAADITQFKIVIAELIRNSLNAVSDNSGGISLVVETFLSTGLVRLALSDNGTGLSAETAEHLFDPFYSGRQAGRGLGFGLCKVWRILQLHGGQVKAVPRSEGGLTMVLDWPIDTSVTRVGTAP